MKGALAALGLALGLAGCSGSPCGPGVGKVVGIVDGDTVDLESGVRIRLLLVDTPETTGGKMDCYGKEAKAFTAAALEGKTVSLQYESECKDRFGRTLAYVTVDGKEHNTALVQGGLACTLYISPNGTSRKAEFEDLESVAKTNRTGMWGACGTLPDGGPGVKCG